MATRNRPARPASPAHPLEQPTGGGDTAVAELPQHAQVSPTPAAAAAAAEAPAEPQMLSLHVDASKFPAALVQQLLDAGAIVAANPSGAVPLGGLAGPVGLPALPTPIPVVEVRPGLWICARRAFALRKLVLKNKFTGQERLFCCLPTVPPELWAFNPTEEEVTNGTPAGTGEILNYDEPTRDGILRAFGQQRDVLKMNDQGPPVPLPAAG